MNRIAKQTRIASLASGEGSALDHYTESEIELCCELRGPQVMTAQVFLSHSSIDKKIARTICTALERRGLKCWIAGRDVGPGENFQEAIVKAIRAAKVMVLVFTSHANNSDEIKKELVLASQNRLTIIPVRMEDVIPNEALAYEFATRQWIDLFADWEGEIDRLGEWIAGTLSNEGANWPVKPYPQSRPSAVYGSSSSLPPQAKAPAAARPQRREQPFATRLSGMIEPVRVIGVLLAVQALVLSPVPLRYFFSMPISAFFPLTEFSVNSFTLFGGIAVVVAGGIIAGVLILRRSPAWRAFGSIMCALSLLWAIFVFTHPLNSLVPYVYPLSKLEFSLLSDPVRIVLIAIYSAGLIVFARTGMRAIRSSGTSPLKLRSNYLRHPFAGARCGHPGHPRLTRTPPSQRHRALRTRRPQYDPSDTEPPGFTEGQRGASRLRRRTCRSWRWDGSGARG